MTTKPYASSVFPWLRENCGEGSLGGLTGQDRRALQAAVHLVDLWHSGDETGREHAVTAFGATVKCMQVKMHWCAFHAIAHVADWHHREELWTAAGLPRLMNAPRCAHEPPGPPGPRLRLVSDGED